MLYFYWITQFQLEDFDSPRPRLVRCVSCAPTRVAGTFFIVGADAEADEAGGADDDASAIESSLTQSGMVEVPEMTLTRRATAVASVDDSVAVEMDTSTRAARLEILSAKVCIRATLLLPPPALIGSSDSSTTRDKSTGVSLSFRSRGRTAFSRLLRLRRWMAPPPVLGL